MVSLCWRNWFLFVLLVFPFAYIQLNAEMTNGNWNTSQRILEENNMKFNREKKKRLLLTLSKVVYVGTLGENLIKSI